MMFHSSSSPITSTFLGILAASVGIPFVAAAQNNITTDDLLAKIAPTAALPGFNVEGGSVFTNLANTINAGQLFFIVTATLLYEGPETEPAHPTFFNWCSDLTFSDVNSSSLIGYAGRCAGKILSGYEAMVASGAQIAFDYSEGDFVRTMGISSVFVEQQNVFEGQFHANIDDWVYRYWDDGRETSPFVTWEGHDEGDMSPNAATSSRSGFGDITWMSVDEVAQLFNTSVDEFTPETFKQVYFDTWIKDHEEEAAVENPFPDAELEIIDQVKNETNHVDDTAPTTPVQLDSTATEDGGNSDGANPVVEDDSGSGRQLMLVGARFVSAALRVFGI